MIQLSLLTCSNRLHKSIHRSKQCINNPSLQFFYKDYSQICILTHNTNAKYWDTTKLGWYLGVFDICFECIVLLFKLYMIPN